MLYHYKGFGGCESQCDLEIHKNLVIVTEIPENEGTSVTNVAEQLATQICEKFKIDPSKLIWIEHYPERGEWKDYDESYDLVQFNLEGGNPFFPNDSKGVLSNPRWTPITKEVAEALKAMHTA